VFAKVLKQASKYAISLLDTVNDREKPESYSGFKRQNQKNLISITLYFTSKHVLKYSAFEFIYVYLHPKNVLNNLESFEKWYALRQSAIGRHENRNRNLIKVSRQSGIYSLSYPFYGFSVLSARGKSPLRA